jgi:hypothetical protein
VIRKQGTTMETLAPNFGKKATPGGTPSADLGAYPELRLEVGRKNFAGRPR